MQIKILKKNPPQQNAILHNTLRTLHILYKICQKLPTINISHKSSVIRQKGESKNEYFKKTKHAKFFGKFGALCFLETPILRFALLPY